MTPTNINLTEQQRTELKWFGSQSKVGMAGEIRVAIEAHLEIRRKALKSGGRIPTGRPSRSKWRPPLIQCPACDYDEAEGELLTQCSKCMRAQRSYNAKLPAQRKCRK